MSLILQYDLQRIAQGERNRTGGAEENRIKSEVSINHRTEIRLRLLANIKKRYVKYKKEITDKCDTPSKQRQVIVGYALEIP